MEDEKKVLRRKLGVISLGEPKAIGKATLYPFKANDPTRNADLDFEFWSKTFLDYIKPDTEIDVDVEYSQKGDFKHRKVIQLYKDGQGVLKPKAPYSGGSKRDEDRTDARTALMELGRAVCVGIIKPESADYKLWQTTCRIWLHAKVTKKEE